MRFYSALLVLGSLLERVSAVKYSEYIYAPDSRQVRPVDIYRINGTVEGGETLLKNNTASPNATLSGQQSSITFDFGANMAGRISFTVGSSGSDTESIGVTYTESSQWVNSDYSDTTGTGGGDVPYVFDIATAENYTIPPSYQRGGFRYLSLTLQTDGPVSITDFVLNYTAMPHWGDDLKQYTGYFHSNDELLNRIWYAGAYTTQLCTIAPDAGDALVQDGIVPPGDPTAPPGITYVNVTISNGSSVVTDGAKRSRLVWPGDYSVTSPAIAVSTYDLISIQNGIDSLFAEQNAAGQLPYCGYPWGLPANSFSTTYHLHNLIALANHYDYSGDATYLAGKWTQWKLGMKYILGTIDKSGLMDVTSSQSQDWGRFNMGGHNIEANSILHYTLNLGLTLAEALNDTTVVADYTSNMTTIKTAINALLWNNDLGLYNDNDTTHGTSMQPQDGNTWAIRAGVVPNATVGASVAEKLQARWTAYGAPAPEADNTISPFISSFELEAHLTLNRSQSGLDLLRTMWGYMMDDPRMTNSSFIEGYSADGTLHYPPYNNDIRISYAHGWSTGPTWSLTTYVAGIQLISAAGKSWNVWPQPGDLTSAEAGFSTVLGNFSVEWTVTSSAFSLSFSTPPGTTGTLYVPTFNGSVTSYKLTDAQGKPVDLPHAKKFSEESYIGQYGLPGGSYLVTAQIASA